MKNIRRFLMLLLVFLSLFSFTSCVNLNCETCGDVQNSEVIKLTKKNAISTNKSYSVKATLTPSYAQDTLSWKLEYVDGSSPTYISSYVTMSISSDTKTCTLTKKSSTYRQMKLTCSLASNSSIKATCTIDFFDDRFEFYIDCFNLDFSDIVADDRPLIEAFNRDFDITNDSYYSSSGGTVDLTVKNVDVVEGFLNNDIEEGYFTRDDCFQGCISDILDQYRPGEFEGAVACIWVSADLYYGNTLIYKGVTYPIEFYPINTV